jgi:hypothetical protein
VRSKVSVPSCASRDAVVRRLQNVLQAGTALCVAALPAAQDATWEPNPTDQRAEQRSDSTDDALNLAQIKAELSYLNSLEERRETNVASLKRLKEARDALLGRGGEVAGISNSRKFESRRLLRGASGSPLRRPVGSQ